MGWRCLGGQSNDPVEIPLSYSFAKVHARYRASLGCIKEEVRRNAKEMALFGALAGRIHLSGGLDADIRRPRRPRRRRLERAWT